jgi:hypothetical protein
VDTKIANTAVEAKIIDALVVEEDFENNGLEDIEVPFEKDSRCNLSNSIRIRRRYQQTSE